MTDKPKCSRCPNVPAARGLCRKHYEYYCEQRNRAGIPWYMPADASREHALALRQAGLNADRIGELAGVCDTTVLDLCNGVLGKVRTETHHGILAIEIPTATYTVSTDGARVDPTGTLRRLRALVAFGYTQRYVADRLGMFETNLGAVIRAVRPLVQASTARRVEALYDELTRNLPAKPSKRSIRRAAALGWAPPLAWDDDTIDDPKAKPLLEAIRQPPKLGSVLEDFRVEYLELRDGEGFGLSDVAIADRMNISYNLLLRRLSRLGMPAQRSLSRVAS